MEEISRDEVVRILRAKQGTRSLREFGDEVECSAAYLSDVYRGNRSPGPKLLKAVGLVYRRKTTITYATKRRKSKEK